MADKKLAEKVLNDAMRVAQAEYEWWKKHSRSDYNGYHAATAWTIHNRLVDLAVKYKLGQKPKRKAVRR